MAKFSGFRQFKIEGPLETTVAYLQRALTLSLKELQTGLQNLSFQDNFDSFEVTVTISGGDLNFRVQNRLDVIPAKRIIVRSNSNQVIDGTSKWTQEYLYLGNPGLTDAEITVVFMR